MAWSRKQKVLCAAVAILCVSIGGGLAAFRGNGFGSTHQEVDRAQLTMQSGRLCLASQSAPFTGLMVERYPNGTLKSRSALRDGRLDGLSEGFYTNGQVQVRETFTQGVSDGLRQKWHPNGTNLAEVRVVRGRLEGTFHRWHENGNLAEEIPMQGGVAVGTAFAYYPSGCVMSRTHFENGSPVEQRSWPDGEMRTKALATTSQK